MGGIKIIELSNTERPGFRNVKITNIKITKDEIQFFHLRIYIFISQNEIVKFEKFLIFLFEK